MQGSERTDQVFLGFFGGEGAGEDKIFIGSCPDAQEAEIWKFFQDGIKDVIFYHKPHVNVFGKQYSS